MTQVESLTELTQASELLEQVLVHIREPTLNNEVKTMEALQILEAIIAFLAQCNKKCPTQNAVFSSAVAVCRR